MITYDFFGTPLPAERPGLFRFSRSYDALRSNRSRILHLQVFKRQLALGDGRSSYALHCLPGGMYAISHASSNALAWYGEYYGLQPFVVTCMILRGRDK